MRKHQYLTSASFFAADDGGAGGAPMDYSGGLSVDQAMAALEREEASAGGDAEADPPKEPTDATEETPASVDDKPSEGEEDERTPEESNTGAEAQSSQPEGITDLSTMPDTALVKVGNSTLKVADLKDFEARRNAQEQAGLEIAQERAQAKQARQIAVDVLKRNAESAQSNWLQYANQDHEGIKQAFLQDGNVAGWNQYVEALNAAFSQNEQAQKDYEAAQGSIQKETQEQQAQALQAMSKSLTDPATGIPGYNQERHNENCRYAEKMGIPREQIASLYDPAAWRIVDQARRFAAGEKAVAQAKIAPAAKTAKPAVRSRADNTDKATEAAASKTKALANLKQTGSRDAGMEALKALGL